MDDLTLHAIRTLRETTRRSDADTVAEAVVDTWHAYEGKKSQTRDVAGLMRQERARTLEDVERWFGTLRTSLFDLGDQIEKAIKSGEMPDTVENWKKRKYVRQRAKLVSCLERVMKDYRRRAD